MDTTVFIIDDDSSVRRSLARLLGDAGHAVETFGSAEAFLEALPAPSSGPPAPSSICGCPDWTDCNCRRG